MAAITSKHTYKGMSEINFIINDQDALSVTINTIRLHMRSVEPDDCDAYTSLYADKEVVQKYSTGETKTKEEIRSRINDIWVKRWREKDPYSSLAVFTKSNEFVGQVTLGHGDNPGVAELAGIGNKNYWQNGYGTEAAMAVVQEYGPALVKEGYTLEGKELTAITATARPDNPGSFKILEKLGMKLVGRKEIEKYKAERLLYSIDLK